MSLEYAKRAINCSPSATLAITARAKELRAQGKDVVGFGAGEPDFPTPENICDAAVQAIREGFTKYTPASGIPELKEAIAGKYETFNHVSYKPSQIVISNGGKHSLTNIFTAILNPGDEVIIPAPYWLSYPEMVLLADGKPVIVPTSKENAFKITAEKVAQAVTDKTKALILNTPNNPTGMLYTKEELEAIAAVAVEKDFYVVADEMYEYLVYDGFSHVSIASLNEEIYKRTITCSGLSKTYAMTGWRIGYTASSEELAKMMGAIQSHQTSNPNSVAQRAALEAMTGPQEKVFAMRDAFDERRHYMLDRLSDMPHIDVCRPNSAFYVFADFTEVLKKEYKGETIGDDATLARILLDDYHVALIPCDSFGCPGYMRFSYAIAMEQITEGLSRIEKFLREL